MATETPLTLHWLDGSKASRILWLLTELDAPFAVKAYYKVNWRAPPEVADVHPLGKCPIVEDTRDGKHKVLAESVHIVNYLVKHYDTQAVFTLKDEEEAELVDYYTQLEAATLGPNLQMVLIFNVGEYMTPWLLRPLMRLVNTPLKKWYSIPESLRVLDFLELQLAAVSERVGESKEIYFVGDRFTQADLMLFFCINMRVLESQKWENWKTDFKPSMYPNLMRWADQIKKRPAYIKAQKKDQELNAHE